MSRRHMLPAPLRHRQRPRLLGPSRCPVEEPSEDRAVDGTKQTHGGAPRGGGGPLGLFTTRHGLHGAGSESPDRRGNGAELGDRPLRVGPIDVELVEVVQLSEGEVGMAFVTRSSSGSLEGCCTIFPRVEPAGVPGIPRRIDRPRPGPEAPWLVHRRLERAGRSRPPQHLTGYRRDRRPPTLRTSPRGGPPRSEA
jgi:hypothetical protein